MNLKDGSTIVANLTTLGRKTGQPRTVELRFLYSKGKFYATSSQVAGKHWCQNMIKNPAVEITAKGEKFVCMAKQVTDDDSLSDVKEIAKRRCNREQHGNRAQNPDVERGLSIYGCFHLR